jgi:large subunit ribosomal protein L13
MNTLTLKPAEVKPQWWIVDATDKVAGRLATEIARVLMGKHNPQYTPHVVCGDFVIVINADKVKLTGSKWQKKVYDKYTGYVGGRKTLTATQIHAKRPQFVIEHAVWRMLPKSKLQKLMMRRLKVYAGTEHPHQAQQAQELKVNA